jgi:hypothetical protein
MKIGLHDSNGGALGSAIDLYGDSNNYTNTTITVMNGQTYYLRITGGGRYNYSSTGTFKTALSTSSTAP